MRRPLLWRTPASYKKLALDPSTLVVVILGSGHENQATPGSSAQATVGFLDAWGSDHLLSQMPASGQVPIEPDHFHNWNSQEQKPVVSLFFFYH